MTNKIDIGPLVDGDEQKLCCADCNKPLLNYKVIAPEAPIKHKFRADCPFCNGSSFTKEINGMIVHGPIGSDQSNSPTVIDDVDEINGVQIFSVIKKRV